MSYAQQHLACASWFIPPEKDRIFCAGPVGHVGDHEAEGEAWHNIIGWPVWLKAHVQHGLTLLIDDAEMNKLDVAALEVAMQIVEDNR